MKISIVLLYICNDNTQLLIVCKNINLHVYHPWLSLSYLSIELYIVHDEIEIFYGRREKKRWDTIKACLAPHIYWWANKVIFFCVRKSLIKNNKSLLAFKSVKFASFSGKIWLNLWDNRQSNIKEYFFRAKCKLPFGKLSLSAFFS